MKEDKYKNEAVHILTLTTNFSTLAHHTHTHTKIENLPGYTS